MSIDPDRPATQAQIQYCKDLFRKVKLHYNCLGDIELVREVRERTGFNLDQLTHADVQKIITKLKSETDKSKTLCK